MKSKAEHIQEIHNLGLKRVTAAKAVRQICYFCKSKNWYEVAKCLLCNCPGWAFRFGYNPHSKNVKIGEIDMDSVSVSKNTPKKNAFKKLPPLLVGSTANVGEMVAQKENATSTPLRAKSGISPKNGFSEIQIDIINFLIDVAAFFCGEFTGLDIETMKCGKFHLASYKLRQLRYLNEKYGIYQVKKGSESKYKIIKTVEELEKLFEMKR